MTLATDAALDLAADPARKVRLRDMQPMPRLD